MSEPKSISLNGITLSPCTPTDFPALAALESTVFYHDEFSIVAFGPERASAENLAIRTRGLRRTLEPDSQKSTEYFKAVDGGGEIVGWSSVSYYQRSVLNFNMRLS